MNNGNNNLPNFKFQSSQKMREIENQLEREITGIVNKQRSLASANNRYTGFSGMSENVSSKLKSFLDDRLANRGLGDKGFNERAYEQSLDYEYDDKYSNKHQHQVKSEDNNYEDDYYEEEEDYDDDYDYEDDHYEDDQYEHEDEDYDYDIKKGKSNPNSYLPFTYEELQPEIPSEEMVLDAMMPAIAQWLDLNIDRIVHKAVKESLSNRGQPDRYSERGNIGGYSRESSEYNTRYTKLDREPQSRNSERLQRTRISDSIKSIEKGSVRGTNSSRVASSSIARDSVGRNSSARDTRVESQGRKPSVKKTSSFKSSSRPTDRLGSSVGVKSSKNPRSSINNKNTTKR